MEEKRPRLGSAVLVQWENKFLLGQRNKTNAQGKWVIPGGGVHFGEKALDAGKREIKEETNLDITIKKLLCIKEIIATAADYHSIMFFYLGAILHPRLLQPGGDLSDVGFFTIEQIKKMDCVQSVEEVLKEAGYWH